MGEVAVTFTLDAGEFDGNIDGLMWEENLNADGPDADEGDDGDGADDGDAATGNQTNDYVAAPGTVVSILDGGREGDNYIKIKIEAAIDSGLAGVDPDTSVRDANKDQRIRFAIPELNELGALSGAADKLKMVKLSANAQIISGAFTNGALIRDAKGNPDKVTVISSQNAVSVSISADSEHSIAIDPSKDGSMEAFRHLVGAKKGYVKLADVTIMSATKRVLAEEVKATDAMLMYTSRAAPQADGTRPDPDPDTGTIWSLPKDGTESRSEDILDLNGEPIDAGLRGTLTISAAGTRGLFNEDDMMFVDYDGDGASGDSEDIPLEGEMGEGSALSIDPDKSDSFSGGDVLSTGTFSVYYMAGGKAAMNHGSTIEVTASVDYSDPSALNEAAKSSTTTLNFAGVGSPIMAYAIPHSSNRWGDKGNLRVRCEQASGMMDECRVFLECWDQEGNRGFGEAPGVGENETSVWNSAAVEGVAEGLDEPESRISCRVLSKGMVTVQQLTRDGNSQTLVNNTYVGESM
ncbi:MAG: hypothetical protein F4Y26_03500 [Gammaproteobacteria bacterium]|nr:hypothetical protein [Gammaproteobacteria bacterium]